MRVATYKAIEEMDEKILAIYIAYKNYFPNSIITQRTASHIYNSGRTKEKSYQVVNRQIKVLIENNLIVDHLKGWRLISKAELAMRTNNVAPNEVTGKLYVAYAPIIAGNTKETTLYLTLSKISTRLARIEYRKLTKSQRPNKSLRKHLKNALKKSQGALTQISFTTLAKHLGVSRDTARRRVNELYKQAHISMIGSTRTIVRKIHKLEEPILNVGEFIHKNWIYRVTSPFLRVNNEDLRKSLLEIPTQQNNG
jgi:DNA-binding transcriptional regulator YhcF (GntR family)